MNAKQFTRCPHCKATFEVTESQLAAAQGKVRCGACMEVFDAVAYLISNEAEQKSAVKAEDTKVTPIEPEATEPDAQEDTASAEEELIFEDSEEDKALASKNIFDDTQLSDSFKDLDSNSGDAFASEAAHFHEDEPASEEEDTWASEMLADETTSDSASAPVEAEPVEPFFAPEKDEHVPTDTNPTASDFEELETESIDFYYQEQESVRSRGLASKVFIGLTSIVLIVVLAGQAAWFYYEKLAQYPVAKAGFEFACSHIGCELPELVDLGSIRSNNLVVRSHPITPQSLIIDVVLVNEATFDQDYPRLAFYFSDINGQTVAQQIVTPDQYLNDQFSQNDLMPKNTPIHVSLEVADPGKRAVNYKIRFFPNKSDNEA